MNVGRFGALATFVVATSMLLACAGNASADPTPEPTPGPSARFQSTQSLTSYRWSAALVAHSELLQTGDAPAGLGLDDAVFTALIEGERVNPDRERTHSVFEFGVISLEREEIVIDGRLWTRQQGGAWRERGDLVVPEDLQGQDVSVSLHVMMGGDDHELLTRLTRDFEARPHTLETVNGRETRHWVIDDDYVRTILADAEELFPGLLGSNQVTVEVWNDIETAVAIRVIIRAATETNPEVLLLQMDLWDMNDPSISVEPPVGAIGR